MIKKILQQSFKNQVSFLTRNIIGTNNETFTWFFLKIKSSPNVSNGNYLFQNGSTCVTLIWILILYPPFYFKVSAKRYPSNT